MPTFPVRRTTFLLQRNFKHLMWMAGAASLFMAALIGVVLVSSPSAATGIMCTGLAIFVGRYLYLFLRGRQARRQLQLESRFMTQPLNKKPVSTCLQEEHTHLWSRSHTWEALKRALQLPMPRLVLMEEKLQRLQRFYRLAYFPLQLRTLKLNLYTVGSTAGIAMLFLAMSPPAELVYVSGIVLLVIFACEAFLWYQRIQIRRKLAVYLRGLSRWTLAERQRGTLRDDLQKPYRHHLLYNAPRWFPVPSRRRLPKAA